MELFENNPFIPLHRSGKQLDLEYSVTKGSVQHAAEVYKTACHRLLRPYLWHGLSGKGTAEFAIYEKDGDGSGPVKISDRLVIDIPAELLRPESHDWVKVEDIKQDVVQQADESIGLKLRACAGPGTTDANADHFFTDEATSTLIIKRTGNVVAASYHGRNEKPNTETGDAGTNIRNGIVALGAMIGLSKVQWEALLQGLLADNGPEPGT